MLQITYDYYTTIYGGSVVSEQSFDRVITRTIGIANGYTAVDLYTLDDSDYTPDDITRLKTAICASADCVSPALVDGSSELKSITASESVAGMWSRSYVTEGSNSADVLRQNVYAILDDYLTGTQFIRRGYYISG